MRTHFLPSALVFALFAPAALAGSVRLITPAGEIAFEQIQPAVDAAHDGDALLVAEGTYGAFAIDGKALSVFAVPGAEVVVDSNVTVRNLGAHQTVVLCGLFTRWYVNLTDNEGVVRLQDCQIGDGEPDYTGGWPCQIPIDLDGIAGLHAVRCAAVAVLDCLVYGGPGANADDNYEWCHAGTGGPGIFTFDSTVALYETSVRGGFGGSTGMQGSGRGGVGIRAVDATLFASAGSLQGGPGGLYWNSTTGPGGDGVWLSEATVLTVLGCPVAGFSGGTSNGHDITGPGTYEELPGGPRRVAAPTVISADAPLDTLFDGAARDLVWLQLTQAPGHVYLPILSGVWLTRFPPAGLTVPAGQAGSRGTLAAALPLPALADTHATLALQGLAATAPILALATALSAPAVRLPRGLLEGGAPIRRVLASARHVLAIDPDAGTDCNANGVNDLLDVALGTSADADHDLVPDECAP